MIGFGVRLRLFLKLWFTSLYTILIMLLIPITAFVIYSQSSYTVENLASLVYEEVAPIWFILILQWCLSIDIDSKFHMQMMTYPIARWKFPLERLLFSAVIFIGLLSIVSLALTPFMGSFVWQGLVFTIPIYITFAGIAVVGTVFANHSVGGLVGGILFWMFYDIGAILLGNDLQVIMLGYGSVYTFVNGTTDFWNEMNHWILYNRLFYMGIGVLLAGLAIWKFNRKTA